jgi:cysteinyl-tRNA synthetase
MPNQPFTLLCVVNFSNQITRQPSKLLLILDNIDTRSALDEIRELINCSNNYIRAKSSSQAAVNKLLLRNIAAYITDIMKVFGIIPGDGAIGFPLASAGASNVKITVSSRD